MQRIFIPVMCLVALAVPLRGQPLADSSAAASATSRGILPVPIVFYTPETGWAGGASLLSFFRWSEDRTAQRPSTEVLAVIYTEKRQFLLELAGEWYIDQDRTKLLHDLLWQRFPAYFYGVGRRTTEAEKEPYTVQTASADISADRRVTTALSAGIVIRYSHEQLTGLDPKGSLIRGTVAGSTGGTVFGVGGEIVWDTRDRLFATQAGNFSTLSSVWCGLPGSSYRYLKTKLDARQYLPVDHERSFALQAIGVFIGGTAPFRELGRIGGGYTLRGYYDGRYEDKTMVALQGEFRTSIAGRFGGVVFTGAGTVAPAVPELAWSTIRPSAGFGFRYIFDQTEHLTLRVDFGWGQHSSGVYFMANEAI